MYDKLIKDVQNIINEYRDNKGKKGELFNLLEISGVNTLEVKMCKILAEIINPAGSHGQGTLFLRSFMNEVLNIYIDDEDFEKTIVFTEYSTNENRRIDIVILTPSLFIPIEVKLYAKDQKSQCFDYYKFAKSKNNDASKVFYLTIDGHLPYESDGLTPIKENNEIIGYQEIEPISFSYDISNWLDSIVLAVIDKPQLHTSFVQLKNAIDNLNGNVDKELKLKIEDLISENSVNMGVALTIAECLNAAKEKLIIKILGSLEEKFEKLEYPLEQLRNKYDYKYNNYYNVHNYYVKKGLKVFPALVYRYKKLNAGKEIWFMIEIGSYGRIYCGFVTAKKSENIGKVCLADSELKLNIRTPFGMNKDEWWFYWEYLPTHTGEFYPETNPDFKSCNDAFQKLFDNAPFESFIDLCMERIQIILDNMLEK